MFSRKEPYIRPTEEITLDYLRKTNNIIDDCWSRIIAENLYPYDDVKEHLVLWYIDYTPPYYVLSYYNKQGYTILKNPPKNQSIPELQHFHLLKI